MHSHEPQSVGFQPQVGSPKTNPFAPRPFEVTFPGQEIASSGTNPFPQRSHEAWSAAPSSTTSHSPTLEPQPQTESSSLELDWNRVNLYTEGQPPPEQPWWRNAQAKLTIGQRNDPYEQEADQVAAQVMTMPEPTPQIQRQVEEPAGESEAVEGEPEIQTQPLFTTITPLVQRQTEAEIPVADEERAEIQTKPGGTTDRSASPTLEQQLTQQQGKGSSLPDEVRLFMEPRFGADFSQVRVHTGSEAVQMNQEVGAKAFAHKQDIYFNSGYYSPNSDAGRELLAHELTHTIQQTGGLQRKNKEVRRKLEHSLDSEPLQAKAIAPTVSSLNRYPLQRQPVSPEEATEETLQAKAFLQTPTSYLNRAVQSDLPVEDDEEIQAKSLAEQESVFLTQSSTIEGKTVQTKSLAISSGIPHIQRGFWDSVRSGAQSVASGVSGVVGGGLDAIRQRLLQPVSQLASRMPGYPLLTMILGRDPVTGTTVERNASNLVRGLLSFVPGGEQMFQNLQESRALENAFNWLSEQITRLNLTWDAIRGLFQRTWESLSAGDLLNPGSAFERIQNIFAEPIQRIRNFASAAGQKILEFIFEGAIRLAGGAADQVMGIIRRVGGAFTNIIHNPIGFVGNLVQAVKGGFQRFAGNILTHLRSGLMGWLFGALAGAGLQMPQSFDLRGIISIVLQIVGATYQRLRGMLARRIGEQRVARLEQIFSFLQTLATEGLAGAWQQIVEFAGNLQEMVIGGIREWVMSSIVQAAVTRLVTMFNPAGAVVQAAIAVYNTVMFFVERAQQIATLANAVFESMTAIAAGNLGNAIAAVEQAMARSLPVIISFMARLLGLGNVTGQIRNIIGRVQGVIERAIERLVNFIVSRARSLIGSARGETQQSASTSDTRTPQQKQVDLDRAASEANQLLRNEQVSPQQLREQLPHIKDRYRLVALELVTDSSNEEEEIVHIEGRVNPTYQSNRQAKRKTPEWPPLNLSWHEDIAGAGQGHTLAKHVNVTNQYLLDRIANERIRAATKWVNLGTAQTTISDFINSSGKTRINNWLTREPNNPRLVLGPFNAGNVGLGYNQGFANLVGFNNARIVLKRGGPKGWYILTAYPE